MSSSSFEDAESRLLTGDEYSTEKDDVAESRWRQRRTQQSPAHKTALIYGSFFLNIIQSVIILLTVVYLTRSNTSDASNASVSKYAGLKEETVHVEWDQASVYTSSNYSDADRAWDAINHDSGIVAVPKEWATQKGLPLGSTFPWDKSKSIYFVNAYHGLHCLKNIYRSIMEYREGVPQSLEYHHIAHCLDQLRADVQCTADDTLRVTTSDMRPVTGEGQIRSCRSWDALQQWTLDNQGCYRYGNPNVEDVKETQIPRMRYCQEGTQDLERVREYFGKGEDWKPIEDPVWSWFDEESARKG